MAIARAHLEAEAAKEFGLRVEVAGGHDEMVDGARHESLRGARDARATL
jgi:hypothetical protein